MNAPHIIGLTGPAGCGKDVVAALLQTHVRFSHLKFADSLRSEICSAFGIDGQLLHERATKELPCDALALERSLDNCFTGTMLKSEIFKATGDSFEQFMTAPRSPRQILRWWGTEYRRNTVGDWYWTRILKNRVYLQQQTGQLRHVISDVRFQNEADAIRAMGGQIWQIMRPGLAVDTSHSSETDGSQFAPNVIINNSHDIKHLQAVVLGAWLMDEASMSPHDVYRMGLAHQEQASADWGRVSVHSLEKQA